MTSLRFLTAGESHGPILTVILEGIPAGLGIDCDEIDRELSRRQQGYGRGGRMKIEKDKVKIVSGVRFGETLGSPITLQVENRDFENWKDRMAAFGPSVGDKVTSARPGHADIPGIKKYDRSDIRDILERSSARETTMRVAAGAVAKQFLSVLGIGVSSRVLNIGGVCADKKATEIIESSQLNCRDAEAETLMKKKIDDAKSVGDTLGGIFEINVAGVPVGLGSHIQWDLRLDARLAFALMSIQAVKGVEIGEGFGYASLPGSLAHDEMFYDNYGHITRPTNHAGGIEGGMTNGEDITVRAVMKPIPTLMKPLHSVDILSKGQVLASKERSDVCAVPAASIVGEGMVALVIADAVLEKFGGDSMADLRKSINSYRDRTR